jgi:hypothetical protein
VGEGQLFVYVCVTPLSAGALGYNVVVLIRGFVFAGMSGCLSCAFPDRGFPPFFGLGLWSANSFAPFAPAGFGAARMVDTAVTAVFFVPEADGLAGDFAGDVFTCADFGKDAFGCAGTTAAGFVSSTTQFLSFAIPRERRFDLEIWLSYSLQQSQQGVSKMGARC